MDIETLLSFNWGAMMPEFIILGVATALCLLDLFMPAKYSRRSLGWFAIAGVLVATLSLLSLLSLETTSILYDTFRLDSFAKAFKLILMIGSLLVLLLAESYRPKKGLEETLGEFYQEWTKYEALYKLGKDREYGSTANFELDGYILTAASEDPCEEFDIYYQSEEEN